MLYAYSLGITSSRRIAKLCEQHIVFMALSADSRPHFTSIASFLQKVAVSVDSGFHTKNDLQYLEEAGIDGYVADRDFRKRDDNFEDRDRFKARKHQQEGRKYIGKIQKYGGCFA